MFNLLRFALLPALLAMGWWASRRHPRIARLGAWGTALCFKVCLGILVVTGCFHGQPDMAWVHRWGAHAMVILAWLTIPLAAGILLAQDLRLRPVAALWWCVVAFLLFAMLVLASLTGYLGPTTQGPLDADTLRRFRTLHFAVLPGVIVGLLIVWMKLARPTSPKTVRTNKSPGR